MSAPVVDPAKRGFRAPGTSFMVVGGLVGAVGAYAFQVIGGNTLGDVGFAPIGLLWTTFFILATVLLVPVEQYVTREVASGRKAIPHDLVPAMTMAALGSAVGGGYVALTLESQFDGDPQYIAQIVLLMVGYSLLFVGKGVLSGTRRFSSVGWVLIVESAARLLAGVVALAIFASATSLGWAMVIGGFAALAMRWWRYDNGSHQVPSSSAGNFLGGYTGGTASSQLLLGGAPIAVALLGGSDALISVVFVTFTLYRAPLTLIFALQGRILPYLVGLSRDADVARLDRIARAVVLFGSLLAVAGGVVGWLVGPEVVTLLFKEEFAPSRLVATLAAAGVVAAASAQITSQVLVAEGKTQRLALAWFGGLLAALAALTVVEGEVDARVAVSFVVGEGTALLLMAGLALRR